MSKLITNNQILLSEVINYNLPITKQLDALVGYFYFSGFDKIAENLTNVPVRILVGMDIEAKIGDKVVEFEADKINNGSLFRAEYLENIQQVINNSRAFDNLQTVQNWQIFIKKLENGTMEIRQTKEPNHSKVYLFYKNEIQHYGASVGTVITGSSNLTYSGFEGRNEANVVLDDSDSFETAKKYFDDLWATSVKLVDKDNYDEFAKVVSEKVWLGRVAKPFEMYLRVLKEYFDVEKQEVFGISEASGGEYEDLSYQLDAVEKGIHIINTHNGVIIADVVGLGKSVIASTIAHNLRKSKVIRRTVVICPPHLVEQWEAYDRTFSFGAKVYSIGKVKDALEKERDENLLVIVDEAHKFRNENTNAYADLHKLCQNKKVMLLTATPFNNSPDDIYALIKLFQIPGAATISTVGEMSVIFEEIIRKYKTAKNKKNIAQSDKIVLDEISRELRVMIEPLIIRRSRIDLQKIGSYKKDLEAKNIKFSKINNPILSEYDLGNLTDIYVSTLEQIGIGIDEENKENKDKIFFRAAKYKPLSYLKPESGVEERLKEELNIDTINFGKILQANIAKFMKMLLVKRFESSTNALMSTLNNMIKYHQTTLDWYDKLGIVGIYKKGSLPSVEDLIGNVMDGNDKVEDEYDFSEYKGTKLFQKLEEKGLITIPVTEFEDTFRSDVSKDLDLLNSIYSNWECVLDREADPKYIHLLQQIKKSFTTEKDRKLIIFSEFADTVEYLFDMLQKDGIRVTKYTSRSGNREEVIANFDAGLKTENQKNDFDVLVASDAISEGYNLHRAGAIINYDIPYNPTRVIQRVGRINRINKKMFEELFIYNYFPSLIGSKTYRVEELASLKIRFIHTLLGEDAKVIHENEVEALESFMKDSFENADKINSQESWDTEYRVFLEEHSHSDSFIDAQKLPQRSRCARKKYDINLLNTILVFPQDSILEGNSMIIFLRRGTDYIFRLICQNGQVIEVPAEEGIGLFKAGFSEMGYAQSDTFYKFYDLATKNNTSNRKDKTVTDNTKQVLDTLRSVLSKNNLDIKSDYFDDLYEKVVMLKALPEVTLKKIRSYKKSTEKNITTNSINILLENLKKDIPEDYLNSISKQQKKIKAYEETLLFVEELL